METYSEPENEQSEATVEYAHSLIMAVKRHGTQKPTEEEHKQFESACREILYSTTFYFMLQEPREGVDLRIEETRYLGMVRYLHMRGSAMLEHETELLLALFSPHDAFFVGHGFIETKTFVALCDEVLNRLNSFAKEQVEGLQEWKKLQMEHARLARGQTFSKEVVQGLVARLDPATREKLKSINRDPLEPHVIALGETTRAFCTELSMVPGDNKDFLTFKKSPGWPTNNTLTTTRPFIRVDPNYYAMNPVSMMRTRAAILEDYIRRTDPTYFGNQFAHVRGRVTEELAIRYFSKLLSSAQVFSNVFYSYIVDGEMRRFEADCVVVFDEYLFLLEMKSAPFSTPAMRGASERMIEDLEHLVSEPYKQGLRTLAYLRASTPATLEYENREIATVIDLSKFRKIYIVNITLADIGHVVARLNSARAMGLVDGVVWPWSIYVNDLRVISELIESPAEFLLYLDRRLAVNKFEAIATIDELDYLGWFLKNGLYFEKSDLSGVDRLTPIGYTVQIERYFNFLAGRVSSGPKPSLNITAWYRALVGKLENLSRPGSTYVAQLLLSLDGNEHTRIEEWFKEFRPKADSEPRTLTLLSRSKLPILVLVVYSTKSPKYKKLMDGYVTMKRIQSNGKPLVWIAIEKDLSSVDFGIHEGPLAEPDEQQVLRLMARRRRMYKEYVHTHGEPGRNDPCPCNSGQKFKRCCLEYVASWNSADSAER